VTVVIVPGRVTVETSPGTVCVSVTVDVPAGTVETEVSVNVTVVVAVPAGTVETEVSVTVFVTAGPGIVSVEVTVPAGTVEIAVSVTVFVTADPGIVCVEMTVLGTQFPGLVTVWTSVTVVLQSEGCPLLSVHCAGAVIVTVEAGPVGHTGVAPHGTGRPLSSKQPVHVEGTAGVVIVTVDGGPVGHTGVTPQGIGRPLLSKQPVHVEGTGVSEHWPVTVVVQSDGCPLLSVHCGPCVIVTVEGGVGGHTVGPFVIVIVGAQGTGFPLLSKQPVGVEQVVPAGVLGHTPVEVMVTGGAVIVKSPQSIGRPSLSKQPVGVGQEVPVVTVVIPPPQSMG